MKYLVRFADVNRPGSPAFRVREKRSIIIRYIIEHLENPKISILDVGGTPEFWKNMAITGSEKCKIILLNREFFTIDDYPYMTSIVGDGRDMAMFPDDMFDLVISNSVIEHVGNYTNQQQIANEIKRVGKNYFVQTPNYFFPIEPHFLIPFFQFYPLRIRMFLLSHFNIGYYHKIRKQSDAFNIISSIRLLHKRDLMNLFPDSIIMKEKLCGVTQSLLVLGGTDMKRILSDMKKASYL